MTKEYCRVEIETNAYYRWLDELENLQDLLDTEAEAQYDSQKADEE